MLYAPPLFLSWLYSSYRSLQAGTVVILMYRHLSRPLLRLHKPALSHFVYLSPRIFISRFHFVCIFVVLHWQHGLTYMFHSPIHCTRCWDNHTPNEYCFLLWFDYFLNKLFKLESNACYVSPCLLHWASLWCLNRTNSYFRLKTIYR